MRRGVTQTQWRVLAAVVGAAAGLAARNSPVALAARVVPTSGAPDCGMEEVLECVVRHSGSLVVGLARLALAAAAIAAGAAAVGVVAAAVGLVTRRRIASPLLLGGGVMLVMPAIWMAGWFVVFLAT